MPMPTARAGADQDTTSLDPGGGTVGSHRDYLGHCFRWGFVRRMLWKGQPGAGPRVIDLGCGPHAPMAVELATSPPIVDVRDKTYVDYVGVDLNTIKPRVRPKWARYLSHVDLVKDWERLRDGELDPDTGRREPQPRPSGLYDWGVSLEVIEHLSEDLQHGYLKAAHGLLKPGATLILSTPIFNGRAAKNHVRELTAGQLRFLFDKHGFEVVDRFGTFASWNDIKGVLGDDELRKYERLREFYGDSVLACYMAPLYPDHARNNTWVCRRSS